MVNHVKLGGRAYTIVNYTAITALNEHYLHKLIREIGIDRVLPAPDGFPSTDEIAQAVKDGRMGEEEAAAIARQRAEDDAAVLLELEARLADSLRLPELLAGYLLPLGKTEADWTLELARETAAAIARVQTPDDRAQVHRLGLCVAKDFFEAALASFASSQSYFERASATPESLSRSAAH